MQYHYHYLRPGHKQNGRQGEGERHKKPSKEATAPLGTITFTITSQAIAINAITINASP